MRFQRAMELVCLLIAAGLCASAATLYNEAIMGDLSNSGPAPTAIGITLGSNQIFGSTGRSAAVDRDYFTVTVGPGLGLSAITVLPGTQSGGVSFIGIEAGSQVTVGVNPPDATGLLGWWHYSPTDINTNILPEMAIPAQNSSGFTVPLGPGTYSFWVQDFNAGAFPYGFDLTVAAPEPGTFAGLLAGLGILAVLSRINWADLSTSMSRRRGRVPAARV